MTITIIPFLAEDNEFKSLQVIEHSLHKMALWFNEQWGSYRDKCLITTTTAKNSWPITTEYATDPSDSDTHNDSSINYATAASVLFGMHIFTLIVWVHLKI
jgi:hypothetical protein